MAERSRPADSRQGDVQVIAAGAGVTLIGRIIGNALQYLYSISIARMLGAEYFGVYMFGFTIISVAGLVARMGLEVAVIRYVSLLASREDQYGISRVVAAALKYSTVGSVMIGLGLYLTADSLWASLFSGPGLVNVIRILSVSLPFLSIMLVALAATQGLKEMRYTVYCQNVFQPAMNIGMAFALYYVGYTLSGIAFAFTASTFLAAALAAYYLRGLLPYWKNRSDAPGWEKPEVWQRGLIRHSAPILIVTLLTSLLVWTDSIMLGYFSRSSDVGVYNAAARTAMLTAFILTSFNSILSPMISELYNRHERDRLQELFSWTCRWVYIISLPLFVVIVLLSGDIMAIFGGEFMAGGDALIIISAAYFLNALTGSVGIMLIMTGHQKIMMYNAIGVFIFNIFANYLLIPSLGMSGAAIASAISIVAYNLIMLLEVYLVLHMQPYNKKFVAPAIVALGLYCVFYFGMRELPNFGIGNIAVYAPLYLLCYGLLIYRTSIDWEDRSIVGRIFSKRGRLSTT